MRPALRTLGNCVAFLLAMTLALAATRNNAGIEPGTSSDSQPPPTTQEVPSGR